MSDRTPYFEPPDRYSPPQFCGACGTHIIFTPVSGGFRWCHLTSYAEHEVQMPFEWWDTLTGTWQRGTWSPFHRESAAPTSREEER